MIELTNVTICNPNKVFKKKALYIDKGRFVKEGSKNAITVNLDGCTVYPALINAHDHLLGNYWPKVGNGPYLNWKPWDEDLKKSKLYQERSKLTSQDLYELSYYRQILSGVTTVSDHIPHAVNHTYIDKASIRVIKNYTLAHELSSYELKWCDNVKEEIKKSKERNIPFITHIEEGYDDEALNGVPYLHSLGGLYENTILIHCLSCNKDDIKLIKENRANMVWCPTSNYYMFKDTADIKTFIKEKVNVCLGTDSPMSGGLNILEEMKFAKLLYRKIHKKEISSKIIFQMVTINPAEAFNLDKELGSIEENKLADLIVIKTRSNSDPYDTITEARMEDIELCIKEGIPLAGKLEYKSIFELYAGHYQDVKLKSRHPYFLIGKPIELKQTIDKKVGFNKKLDFFPVEE